MRYALSRQDRPRPMTCKLRAAPLRSARFRSHPQGLLCVRPAITASSANLRLTAQAVPLGFRLSLAAPGVERPIRTSIIRQTKQKQKHTQKINKTNPILSLFATPAAENKPKSNPIKANSQPSFPRPGSLLRASGDFRARPRPSVAFRRCPLLLSRFSFLSKHESAN